MLHSSVTDCPLLQSSFTVLKIPYSSMHFVLPFLTTQFLIGIQLYKHTYEYIIYYTYYICFLLFQMLYNWNYVTYGLKTGFFHLAV